MKRPKAMRPEGPWARSAGRGKEFLRRLQVKVPSCIQHHQKTNTRQTTKKQALEPLASPRTHLTCRQARCGSTYIGPLDPHPFQPTAATVLRVLASRRAINFAPLYNVASHSRGLFAPPPTLGICLTLDSFFGMYSGSIFHHFGIVFSNIRELRADCGKKHGREEVVCVLIAGKFWRD